MMDTKIESNSLHKGCWLKRLAWCFAGLIVVLLTLYFVATSSAFFKSVILPWVGSALNADVLGQRRRDQPVFPGGTA